MLACNKVVNYSTPTTQFPISLLTTTTALCNLATWATSCLLVWTAYMACSKPCLLQLIGCSKAIALMHHLHHQPTGKQISTQLLLTQSQPPFSCIHNVNDQHTNTKLMFIVLCLGTIKPTVPYIHTLAGKWCPMRKWQNRSSDLWNWWHV